MKLSQLLKIVDLKYDHHAQSWMFSGSVERWLLHVEHLSIQVTDRHHLSIWTIDLDGCSTKIMII